MTDIDLKLLLGIAGVVGAIAGGITSFLKDIFLGWRSRKHEKSIQKANHNQKRIELHVDIVREKLNSIEKQLNDATNSSAATFGYRLVSIDLETEGSNRESQVNAIASEFEIGFIKSELAYLEAICKWYVLDERHLTDIKNCSSIISSAARKSEGKDDFDKLIITGGSILSIMIELRVLYRMTLHLLIDKFLKVDDNATK